MANVVERYSTIAVRSSMATSEGITDPADPDRELGVRRSTSRHLHLARTKRLEQVAKVGWVARVEAIGTRRCSNDGNRRVHDIAGSRPATQLSGGTCDIIE